MKTKEELISRYEELYHKMETSKDPKDMEVFLDSECWVFKHLAETNPELAENWLSHLEAVSWNNYLSEHEAMNISKRTVNQDGMKGFHWGYDAFMNAVETFDGMTYDHPYYNCYALWTVANIMYSDHAQSIAMDMGYDKVGEVPGDKMALSCYRKAVEKLKDVDNPRFVRKYFKDKMYDD